jgi:hypothetical protein
MLIGIVGVTLVLGAAAGAIALRPTAEAGSVLTGPAGHDPSAPGQPASGRYQPGGSVTDKPEPAAGAPVTVVDGGTEASFGLPVGTAVRYSDPYGTWTVTLLGAERVDRCGDFTGGAVKVVVFDLDLKVTEGVLSVVPTANFVFVLPDGTTAAVRPLPTCAAPPLATASLTAGQAQRGRIGVELPAGVDASGGRLTYGLLGVPTASWTIS